MRNISANRELVRRLIEGDDNAVSELATTYQGEIYRLALRLTKNHADAEEVTQDVLLQVNDRIGAFRGDAALSSWVHRITFNMAISRMRSRKRRHASDSELPAPSPSGANLASEIADWSSLADDAVYRKQMRRELIRALTELPPDQRIPVILRDVDGLSTREASALLHLRPATFKTRLHRGRLKLRHRLAEFAGGLTLHQQAA